MRVMIAFVLLLLPAVALADLRQHGNIVFNMPDGWAMGSVDDKGTLTLYSDLPNEECEYCYAYLSVGDTKPMAPAAYLAAQARRFVEDTETDPPEVKSLSTPEGFNLKGRPGGLAGQMVDGRLQILIAVQLFGRMELITFEGPAADDAEAAALMQVFQRDIMPVIEGARFVSEGAAPLLPPPQPGLRDGVYWGTSTYWTMGLDMMMQMQINHHWLTFWLDGRFYDGTPPNGTAGFDPASQLAKGDMEWGSYVEQHGKLLLSYANGEVEIWALADDDGLQQDSTYLYPVEVLPDGTRINGSVSAFFFSGFTPGSGLTGGMSSSSLTEFHPDGSWTFGSSGGAFAGFDTGGGFATSSEDGTSGRYEVKDGLVIQYAPDGSIYGTNLIFKVDADIWIGSEVLGSGE